MNVSRNADSSIVPFEIVFVDFAATEGLGLEYVITDKYLQIKTRNDYGQKDSILFHTYLQQSALLKKLSNINLDSLQDEYRNPYIRDGQYITVTINKQKKSKTIEIANEHVPEIAMVVEIINTLVPKEYQIRY